MPVPIRFNCGEFFPGQKPIYVPGLKPPVPPTYVGTDPVRPHIPPGSHPIRIPPFIPDWPGDPSGPRGPRFEPHDPMDPSGPQTPGRSTGGGRPRFDPGDPRSTGTGTVLPGVTNPSRYRCNEVIFYCPDDLGIEPPSNRRIRETRRYCTVCTQQVVPETGALVWPADCIHITREACIAVCSHSAIADCISSPNQTNTTGLQVTQSADPRIFVETNTGIIGSSRPVQIVNIEDLGRNQTNVVGSFRPEGTFLYHPGLNIIEIPNTTEVVLVDNSRHLDVLSNRIASEIEYILNNSNTNNHWSEIPIQNLTLEKIRDSLNPALRTAFQNIHYPGGLSVSPSLFYEAVRKHIITGTLEEFDPAYYIELSHRQYNDTRIQYNTGTAREYIERAALGLIAESGISSDPTNFESIQRSQLSRQRRLNEDIKARINVCTLGGSNFSEMHLTDLGICNPSGASVPIGPGHGYYIQLNSFDNGCIGLETTNNLSSSYYVPADIRFNALTLFGFSPAITLLAESISAQGEFDSGFSVDSLDISPRYLALVLSSISEEPTPNPLVNRTSARYELLSDQELIDEHTDSNGFAVSRIAIDYTDYLFKYIADSSSVSLSQYDVNFRGFESNNGIVDNAIISRNIPFAVIATPVKGAKFNPFNVRSRIESFSGSVIRSISMVPSIDISDNRQPESPLEERVMFSEVSSFRIGVVEPNETQNILHRFNASSQALTNTYFNGTSYGPADSLVSSYGSSYLVKNIIDTLIETYDPSTLTWWDIYSRMPMSKFGELMYDSNTSLHLDLARGFRNQVTIHHVLDRYGEDSPNILDEDDMTILDKDLRYARKNS